ncbi:MAG TPA: Shedu immune nuclease family protein [Gaiellaceae bacterium]|nr:Shedu immune nuclease family protein [Gaiellaceae bacterium]
MSRFDDWHPPLQHKLGGPARLLGIDMYHDFPWSDVVTHGMAQFSHGLRLAELARDNCKGKTPALILTTKTDELEGAFETDTHHYIVVCLPRYLVEAEPNEAVAYLARRADVYEARAARLEELLAHPEMLDEVLTAEQVADWLSLDPERSEKVAQEMASGEAVPTVDPARAIVALSRYWKAVADEPELREALFTDEGASTAFARWLGEHPLEAAAALLDVQSGDLAAFDAVAGIARLQRFVDEWQANRENAREEDWQELLTRESWVLGQLFGAPFVIVRGKAYVGGKTFENLEGRITDFLYKNRLTGNVLIVEIKTPITPLVGTQYRQVFPPSHDLAGGITQVLDQRQSLLENYKELGLPDAGAVPFNPRAVVLIGDLERQEIEDDRRRGFELFRNDLAGVEVVTFDELAAKAEALLEIFREPLLEQLASGRASP